MVHNGGSGSNRTRVFVETVSVFRKPVRSLRVVRGEDSLLVVGEDELAKIPLHHCQEHSTLKTCTGCVALRDPYCAWDADERICINSKYVYIPLHAIMLKHAILHKEDGELLKRSV